MATLLHVKKGDRVKVIAGDDKGVIGDVIAVYPDKGRVTVQGVNIVKRNVADRYDPRTGNQIKGGQVSSEAPIAVSNVQLVVKHEGKEVVTRTGSERKEVTRKRPDGSTYKAMAGTRIPRKTGEEI